MRLDLRTRVRAYAVARGQSFAAAIDELICAGLEWRAGQARGARAVNDRRTPEERSEAARKAAQARHHRV